MTLRLYDTRAQALRDFSPLDEKNVTMYVCGPTVQSGPHVGHLRASLAFDLLRRWLEHRYGRVTFVRNVTDIDDKTLANATEAEPWWALAYRVEREFTAVNDAIGILPPTYEPRATGSIDQMQELIASLIERGHAYASEGDVYFDVRSWPEYGALTRQRPDEMDPDVDADLRGKRDAHDFALWKATKAGEPETASWPSPWGPGRPGWHIECSAMSRRYLGDEFDIHGGGLDLRFPHHENELAQSTAAGHGFARYWVHNGLVTVNGQKMSKSLGNFVLAADLLAENPARVVRYALSAAHYRSSLDVSEQALAEASSALDRIEGFAQRGLREIGPFEPSQLPEAFVRVMDDDLGVPQALAVVHETVRAGNTALDAGDREAAAGALSAVFGMMDVLGLPLYSSAVASSGSADQALGALVDHLLTQRQTARAEKDWATADRLRDTFVAAGITLEDTPSGTHWSIDG
ncbi:cysteine--tRNA ligase [Microbacterium sorbitolivorans]|uniref:Cysteine--tRNA ligase n=1 Tax=Microbacterium sorbitolivorans TaxID=1867410 RepID=A0A367XUB9_9MICO|nr:cysteine--tRNA ligase [Microbacterium sorbitolivorans]RCK56989.1 cysteine--tRNA ligase [Microbacterium sorbitolivorans]GGF47592.1 cysteine--tRNA ligase [Microbacterium sorbitolivorans]